MKFQNKSKLTRLEAIKSLINENLISDQDTIVKLLKDKFKIETNQTKTSRDLRILKITKREVNGKLYYQLPTIDVTNELLKLAIVSIDHNEAMIIIITQPGLAAFVGDYLDKNPLADVLGSLAGENVVFVMPRTINEIKKTYRNVCALLNAKIKE